MEQLWAPWRMEYILMQKAEGCVLCSNSRSDNDAQNFILYRGQGNFVVLNKYPYNPGHLMVVPYRHLALLDDLTEAELLEHFEMVRRMVRVLRETFNPQGFNIGINLGKVAGAGIEDHVHTHVVPRWNGDTNFMPVIGNTKVMPDAMDSVYRKLVGKVV